MTAKISNTSFPTLNVLLLFLSLKKSYFFISLKLIKTDVHLKKKCTIFFCAQTFIYQPYWTSVI